MGRGALADFEPGRRGLSVGQLSDGETASFRCEGNPYTDTHQIPQGDGTVDEAEAIHVPVSPEDVPDGFADMNGDPVDSDEEYNLINSSTGFYLALCRALGIEPGEEYDGSIESSIMHVSAVQEGDEFSRDYQIEFE